MFVLIKVEKQKQRFPIIYLSEGPLRSAQVEIQNLTKNIKTRVHCVLNRL